MRKIKTFLTFAFIGLFIATAGYAGENIGVPNSSGYSIYKVGLRSSIKGLHHEYWVQKLTPAEELPELPGAFAVIGLAWRGQANLDGWSIQIFATHFKKQIESVVTVDLLLRLFPEFQKVADGHDKFFVVCIEGLPDKYKITLLGLGSDNTYENAKRIYDLME